MYVSEREKRDGKGVASQFESRLGGRINTKNNVTQNNRNNKEGTRKFKLNDKKRFEELNLQIYD